MLPSEGAVHFTHGDENTQQSDEESVLAVLDSTAEENLTGHALRLVLSDHIGIPHESQPDLLTEGEQVFGPKKPKAVRRKTDGSSKSKPAPVKASAKKKDQYGRKLPSGPSSLSPGFVRGRFVSRRGAKSRRENARCFLLPSAAAHACPPDGALKR